jgi:hypothetical protein
MLARVGLVVASLLVTLLAGCSSADESDERPGPDDAVARLAQALATGDFSGVRFAAGTPAASVPPAYTAVRGELAEVAATVSPGAVVEADSGADSPVESQAGDGSDRPDATAILTWTWDLGSGRPWTYDVDVALVRDAASEWQVEWSPSLIEPSLVTGEVLGLRSITPNRGDVTGQDGLALVTEREVSRVGIDKPTVTGPLQAAARTLASVVDVDPGEFARRVKSAGDQAFVEAIVYRADELPIAVARGVRRIDGARIIAGNLPLAPTREFAAPILGRVGEVTAEMIEEDPDAYRVGDIVGLSGLQARYDDTLRGTPGLAVHAVDPDGGSRELTSFDPVDGADLQLTLDVDLQIEAEALLAEVGPASALVALRPSTGEILAAANGPGNDGLNVATYGQFAPGSTFKIVTSLALLRAGLNPDSIVSCPASVVVDGRRFTNYSDYPADGIGRITLRRAVANSCNTAFITQADRLDETGLFDAGVSLGIGLDHDLGFPAYFGNVVPTLAQTEAAAQTIGQGTILASPMVMASVIGTVQSGSLAVPYLVRGVETRKPDGAQPLTDAEAAGLRDLLRAVVTDGSGRGLLDAPGPPVIAKTGTAEFGSGEDIATHAWMIAAQGDLAVAVFVQIGDSGSGTAGPILEGFLRAAR